MFCSRLGWSEHPNQLGTTAKDRPMTDNGPLRIERDETLTIVTIDSPPMNLFGAEMFAAWPRVVDELAAAPPRGLLIRADGKVVSAGVDVSLFDGLGVAGARRLWAEQIQMIRTLEQLPCPTVFAAHALTLTASFEIALACDVLVASAEASFGLVERRVGITPSMGGVQRLADRAGVSRAKELVMTGEIYDAPTLHDWGVVTRLVGSHDVAGDSLAYARALAEGPTQAHRATKALTSAYLTGGIDLADARLPAIGAELFATDDNHRAVAAFLEHGPRHEVEFTGH
jgi:enoyl-CoA hydratase